MPEPTDPKPTAATDARPEVGGLFHEPAPKARTLPLGVLAIAAIAVLVVIVVLAAMGHRHSQTAASPNTLQPLSPYAPQLHFSNIQLSEATSFSGGKETYVDGRLTNSGPSTVTGITAQVLFASDGGGGAQLETVPVTLIRSRQPYIDTEPISAAPLAPGAGADFRMTFDDIHPEWDQQPPEIHVTNVETR